MRELLKMNYRDMFESIENNQRKEMLSNLDGFAEAQRTALEYGKRMSENGDIEGAEAVLGVCRELDAVYQEKAKALNEFNRSI